MKWTVEGFNKQKKFFFTAIGKGLVSHAYVFVGPAMIGKKKFALDLASNLNNWKKTDQPVLFVDETDSLMEKSIQIGKIRNIKKFLSRSTSDNYKIVIIDNANLMTVEAQNALLKTLEEPTDKTIFILLSPHTHDLLPTIISRCQIVDFFPHKNDVVDNFLTDIKLSQKQKDFLVSFAHGKTGFVKKIIDDKLYSEIKEIIGELAQIISAPLHQRMTIARDIAINTEYEDLQKKVLYWILYMHTRLRADKETGNILAKLLVLNDRLSKAQYNRQIILEDFAVSCSNA